MARCSEKARTLAACRRSGGQTRCKGKGLACQPGLAAILAWPVLGHLPTGPEAAGLLIAVTGLLITMTTAKARSR